MNENIWQFNYKKGPALLSSYIEAKDERTAVLVAQALAAKKNARFVGNVRPFIEADESILGVPDIPVPPPQIQNTVEGDTAAVGAVGAVTVQTGREKIFSR